MPIRLSKGMCSWYLTSRVQHDITISRVESQVRESK